MPAKPHRQRILPKISTMPRPQSEAANYLDLHKLAVEKARLLQELESIEQRQRDICERLTAVEQEMTELKATAAALAPATGAEKSPPAPRRSPRPKAGDDTDDASNEGESGYKTVFLDY